MNTTDTTPHLRDAAEALAKLGAALDQLALGYPATPAAKKHAHSVGYALAHLLPPWAKTALLHGLRKSAHAE